MHHVSSQHLGTDLIAGLSLNPYPLEMLRPQEELLPLAQLRCACRAIQDRALTRLRPVALDGPQLLFQDRTDLHGKRDLFVSHCMQARKPPSVRDGLRHDQVIEGQRCPQSTACALSKASRVQRLTAM